VMVVANVLYEKSASLEYFHGCTTKDVCLISIFVGRCGFSSAGSLEEFSATVIMCGRKYW